MILSVQNIKTGKTLQLEVRRVVLLGRICDQKGV